MPVPLDFSSGQLAPIIYQEIIEMINYYRSGLEPTTNDATSAWVSYREIQELINDNPGANGIRIYYGRHKKSTLNKPIPGGTITCEYKDRHNVILVSTQDIVNPTSPTVENSRDLLNQSATSQNSVVNSVSYSGTGGDFVPLCPPKCT